MARGMKVWGTLGALLAAAALCSPLTSGAHAAKQAHVSCGDTITVDTTLDSDLIDCPNNGIVIGADNITLDLNGHTVAGNGEPVKPCPKEEFCDVGLLNDGHHGVAVRHGSVRDFGVGVFIGTARHARVLGISSSRNPLFGIVVDASARSLVLNNSASGNVGPDGDGIGVFGSHHVLILHNSIRRNGQLGIHVAESTHILIGENVISRNPTAISLEANRNVVSRNRVSRNGNGIGIAGNRNVVRGNRVERSRGAEGGFAIPLEHGDHNLIERNSIRYTQRSAISVGFEPGGGNVVRRNRIRGAGEHGILVDFKGKHTLLLGNVIRGAAEDGVLVKSSAKHTLLRGNRSFGANDDGIDIDSAATTLIGNTANRNHDLGIEALPGVTDGGRNKASGNGNPLQCTNVWCSSG
jgi:parallel beta-helix repeat protein